MHSDDKSVVEHAKEEPYGDELYYSLQLGMREPIRAPLCREQRKQQSVVTIADTLVYV